MRSEKLLVFAHGERGQMHIGGVLKRPHFSGKGAKVANWSAAEEACMLVN